MQQSRTTFLGEVASDLYQRYGAKVGDLKILLPSRRGRIFFTDAISHITTQPIWEPEWISIDEIMSKIAGIEVGEHIRLVAELFEVYKSYHKGSSFDNFYYWGEILLADFDMVDKYKIDADQIFRNISDIKELETDLSYLTPQQMQIVAFWSSIGDGREGVDLSLHKERFLVVWQSLLPIYKEYRERLLKLGIAYSGMVHRVASEKLSSGYEVAKPEDIFVIAGFNALSNCEKELFDNLKTTATTHFYWDWDNYYSENKQQEAGLFINSNKSRYQAATEISHDNFAEPKQIEAVACSSTSLQCKYVANIIDKIIQRDGIVDKRTAIVLTDESLLLPLLYSLPKDIGKVNVTMGYPIKQSLAYSFVERLIELQHHARISQQDGKALFYHVDVSGVIMHPYLRSIVSEEILHGIERDIEKERLISVPTAKLHRSEILKEIFTITKGWQHRSEYLARILNIIASQPTEVGDDAEMRVEFLSFLLDHIIQLQHSIEECNVELESSTYISLLRRHLQPLRIPFEGEPLEGVQVMGILETRTLDFDNVILLSMNDDNFPGSRVTQPSYIPYTLRAAYELPTPEHHDGVYAYYFYRLIQRAKNISMLYCSRADDKSTGEQSRYITQLELESPFNVDRINVGVDVNLTNTNKITIEKIGKVAEQLRRFTTECDYTDRNGVTRREIMLLSPTALFQYIACPLRFYYRYVARIRTSDELNDDIDSPMFGNILHDSMQRLYEPFVGKERSVEYIRKIKKDEVNRAVEEAIRSQYFKNIDSTDPFSGNITLIQDVVVNYITGGILRYDIANPPHKILSVERSTEMILPLSETQRVRLGGVCDRVDLMPDNSIRIVDYKTGSPHLEFAGINQLFWGDSGNRQSNTFQTLLYSYILRSDEEHKGRKITPALYYVRKMNDPDFSPLLNDKSRGESITDYESTHEEFVAELQVVLTNLFDESTPFKQCDDEKSCEYCDFRQLCRR